jgi:hypothetical protein
MLTSWVSYTNTVQAISYSKESLRSNVSVVEVNYFLSFNSLKITHLLTNAVVKQLVKLTRQATLRLLPLKKTIT